MRAGIIFDNAGERYELLYPDKCDINDINFINEFFIQKGDIVCVPLVKCFIKYFETFFPNNKEGLDKLKAIEDKYNIHLIYNSLALYEMNNESQPWFENKFLTSLFGRRMLADKLCIFVAESELSGVGDVSIDYYEGFAVTLTNIFETIRDVLGYDYFETLKVFIDKDTIINITNRKELLEIKDKYDTNEYTLFNEIIFLGKNDENPLILKKNGMFMCVDANNNAEMYFCGNFKIYDENINKLVEKVC